MRLPTVEVSLSIWNRVIRRRGADIVSQHISETLLLDLCLSYVAGLEQGTLRLTNHYHDLFATQTEKREGANSSFVHFSQVTTVLRSEA